jgi:hypothetical protein
VTIKLTFDLLPVLAAVIAILFFVLPGVKDWYDKLPSDQKQLRIVLILFIVEVVVVLLSLLGFLQVYIGPTWREWIWYPLVDFVIALMTSAGVYKSTNYIFAAKPKPEMIGPPR